MKARYDTYCGLYCGACFVMRANEQGCIDERASEWKTKPEAITCHGCKSGVNSGYCLTCEIKSCAQARHVEACFECSDYPCQRLIAFRDDEWPHHSAILANLEDWKQLGAKRWLEAQAERWRCPACGARTEWYDEECPSCGGKVESCRRTTTPPA